MSTKDEKETASAGVTKEAILASAKHLEDALDIVLGPSDEATASTRALRLAVAAELLLAEYAKCFKHIGAQDDVLIESYSRCITVHAEGYSIEQASVDALYNAPAANTEAC